MQIRGTFCESSNVTSKDGDGLLDEVERRIAPLAVSVRRDADEFVADLTRDAVVVWPNYASGPTHVLAVLAAEQRFLAEQVGSGTVNGRTYLDKAEERLRRWRASR